MKQFKYMSISCAINMCLYALAATRRNRATGQELQSIIITLRKVQYMEILNFSSRVGALASGMVSPFKKYI